MTRKKIKEQAARYAKFVEWSDEDSCFIGRCPELMLGGVHGSDEAKVYAALCEAVEEWIELLHKDGTALPDPKGILVGNGKFLRMVKVRKAADIRPRELAGVIASAVSFDRGSKKASKGGHYRIPRE